MSQALAVAKEFVKLALSGDEKDPLTSLRLQKLLYYAQAWSLVVRECELFPEDLEAWRHGPVVPDVYRRLPDDRGARSIDPAGLTAVPDLEPEDAEFVRCVWEAYNPYSALQLSRMTHEERPWQKAWGDRPALGYGNDPIRIEDLEAFFSAQAIPASLAAYCHERRRREEEAARQLSQLPPLDPSRLAAASTSHTPAAARLLIRGE